MVLSRGVLVGTAPGGGRGKDLLVGGCGQRRLRPRRSLEVRIERVRNPRRRNEAPRAALDLKFDGVSLECRVMGAILERPARRDRPWTARKTKRRFR
jgi:hypothetical protein